VTAVVLGGAALWYLRSLPRPIEVRAATRPAVGPTTTPSPNLLIVHVAGEVRRPGVYEFRTGDRVVDAIRAAHGPRKDASLDALNLAAPLTDGEQVLVPGRDAAAVTGGTASGSTTSTTSAGGSLININMASETDLEALPGIGPVLAQRIVDYRTEHGPFPTVDALDDVSGIGPATMEDLRPLISV
jgi:competence protein ComEA